MHAKFQRLALWSIASLGLTSCSLGTITGDSDDPSGDGTICVGVLIGGECVTGNTDGKNSNWHPDPDGDGIPTARDLCPNVYDLDQGDVDEDKIGDYCDDDFVSVVEGGPVVDLRAEHVTPYGAWIRFTSPETSNYGRDYVVAWSTNKSDVESAAGIQSLGDNNKQVFRVFARAGNRAEQPEIINSMDPDTAYYLSTRPLNDSDEPSNKTGNTLRIKTARAPEFSLAASHPRVWATPDQLGAMAQRHQNGDAAFAKWAGIVGPSSLGSADAADYWSFGECIGAALMFHATEETRYRDVALTIIDTMYDHWNDNELKNNILRWADSYLPICTDLMWNEINSSRRNQIVAAYLEDDEAAENGRVDDTDEYASITRTLIVDGLVGCEGEGIEQDLSDRSCALLDRGLRYFYGVQLVKARRDEGFFAQSGGGLPDGTGYAMGTSTYWMHTLHALSNVGAQVEVYAPWVWHNLLSIQIHALTPRKQGYATFGDLDSYSNFDVEPGSLPVAQGSGSRLGMQMGFLHQTGLSEQAGHAKWHVENTFDENTLGNPWAMLLHDSDDILSRENSEGVSTNFLDSGMGLFYDRTDWGEDASFFTFHAGWSGVDHNHADAGSFQIYRNGSWITSEALGYDGDAATALGHNVPQLSIDYDGSDEQVGQFHLDSEAPSKLTRSSSQALYAFVASDLTGIYSSGRYHSFNYEAVQRHILWIKPSDANGGDDRVIVYDLVDNAKDATPSKRAWQLHVDTNHLASEPRIDGSTASYEAGSDVEVTLAVPSGVDMAFAQPDGVPGNFPGEVYTGRLQADAQSTDASLRYVSILRASDAGSSKVVRGVETPEAVGVVSGSDLVLFQRAANQEVKAALTIEVDTEGVQTVWWTGLTPGDSYGLHAEGAKLVLSPGGSLVADEGGVIVGSI